MHPGILTPTRLSVTILNATLYLVRVPLRFSVDHSLASRKENLTGFLILESESGRQGIGELLTRKYVTGETMDDCIACLHQVAGPLFQSPIDDPIAFLERLWKQNEWRPGILGAMAALDQALLDLASKESGRSIAQFFHDRPLQRDLAATYSAAYPFARGVKLRLLNFVFARLFRMKQLKVKGTGRVDTDLHYIERIREAFPYPVDVRLDLNGGLRPDDAPEYFRRMLKASPPVRWFEQPFPKGEWEAASHYQHTFGDELTLCADESFCTVADLERALNEGAYRALNLRIAKNGGLWRTMSLYELGAAAGLELQLGCYVGETSVLSYAGLQFASIVNGLRYHEGCFGKLLVKWDVLQPSLTFARGGEVAFSRLPTVGLVPPVNMGRLEGCAASVIALEAQR